MNVFISWRSSERELKNKIVEKLRSELDDVDHVWESDEGCTSDFSEDCIQAIRESQVFVVLISDNAMKLSYVTNEVVEAHECELQGKLNIVVYKLTDSPYTPKLAGHLNHVSDVHHLARSQGRPDDASLDALTRRVKNLLQRRKQGNPEKPADVHVPVIEGTTVSDSGYFVPNSRDGKLEELESALQKSNIIFVTEMNGYGKKSLVRQYARQHRNDYDTIVNLHFFKGTLRDFFISGIHITNVNDQIFENLNEEQHILKKVSFLEKLDKRTLIIVPDVTVGPRDNAFVMDALASLSCHVIFVTHTLPARMSKDYPVVSIGRMENQYLRELFFNFYTYADSNEQDDLVAPLDEFFDGIDGHTQSVEIAAMTLSEEFGIYPEDIPNILKKISPNSENELGDRIFNLISELFDISSFDDKACKILFVASILARLPLDEKLFVDVLKKANVYDAPTIHKLTEQRWLSVDRESRTIRIDALPAEVCLARIPLDETVLAVCVDHIMSVTFLTVWSSNLPRLYSQITAVFEILNLPQCQRLTQELFRVLYDVSDEAVSSGQTDLKGLLRDCYQELNTLHDEELQENCALLVQQAYGLIHANDAIFSLAERTDGSDIRDTLLSSLLDEDLDELLPFNGVSDDVAEFVYSTLIQSAENEPETAILESLEQLYDTLYSAKSLSKIVLAYEQFGNVLISSGFTSADNPEMFELIGALVLIVSKPLLEFSNANPYLTLGLCRCHQKIMDFFGFNSPQDAYRFYQRYFSALISTGELTAELETVFKQLTACLTKNGAFIAGTQKEAYAQLATVYLQYAELFYEKQRFDEGKRIYGNLLAQHLTQANVIKRFLDSLDVSVQIAVESGYPQKAIELLSERLPLLQKALTKLSSDEQEDLMPDWEELNDILALLRNPTVHTDEDTEYLNYYEEYADGQSSKKEYLQYNKVATQAAALDFSSLSKEELAEKVSKLKEAAKKNTHPLLLAPEAFALVSEAGYRVLGFRHHLVQYIGGAAIAEGKIAEMLNGEGKTYTIILAAFLHTLYGKQVHILDTSYYLCERNFANMRGVLEYLGCTVGLVTEKNYTRNKSFESCDVLYATVVGMCFYRLRNELKLVPGKVRFDVMIADEADYTLIDNGIQSYAFTDSSEGPNRFPIWSSVYTALSSIQPGDSTYYEKAVLSRKYAIKEPLYQLVEEAMKRSLSALSAPEVSEVEASLQIGIRSLFDYEKGKDYFVVDNTVYFENEATGTFYTPSATYVYFLSLKEGIVSRLSQNETVISKPLQRMTAFDLFQCYQSISGTTATARSMRNVLKDIYSLDVVAIPPNKPVIRSDLAPILFVEKQYKLEYILALVSTKHEKGQPIILITPSIAEAKAYSAFLNRHGLSHTLLTAINSEDEPELLGNAGKAFAITVTTAMANRGVDIMLGGNPFELAKKKLLASGYTQEEINDAIYRVHDVSIACQKLRDHYLALTAYYRHFTNVDREAAENEGGLCVIGTECFRDLRVEQQVRGRAGRQGSVGESHMLYSLDDPAISSLLGPRGKILQNSYAEEKVIGLKFFTKTLIKVRKRLQDSYLTQLTDTPLHLYFREAHELIVGTVEKLSKGQVTVPSLFETKIVRNDRLIKQLFAYLSGQRNKVFDRAFAAVSEVIDRENLRESTLPGLLRKQFNAVCESAKANGSSPTVLEEVIAVFLGRAWSDFLRIMDAEIESAEMIYSDQKKKKRFLLNFAKAQATRLLEEYLLKLLTVKFKQPPKSPPVFNPSGNKALSSRNSPCPCGSGKKYKFCCGKDTE